MSVYITSSGFKIPMIYDLAMIKTSKLKYRKMQKVYRNFVIGTSQDLQGLEW